MKLDNFNLEEYDKTNVDHKTTVIEIGNDTLGRDYLGDLEYHIACINKRKENSLINYAYIAYYDIEPVGFISISSKENGYEISYGIRPKYRGEHLGALLLQEFTERVFEKYDNIDEIKLIISNVNTGSKKTALLAGYEKKNSSTYTQRRM